MCLTLTVSRTARSTCRISGARTKFKFIIV
eukprot:SAG31_NODE_27007_length_432_cov_1.393393_1_plen_29_part_01